MTAMYKRILVAVDGSPTSARGLDEAIQLGRLLGSRLMLAHVIDEMIFATGFETGATYMKDVLPQLRRNGNEVLDTARKRVDDAGLAAETRLLECFATRTSDVLLSEAKAWGADLIVLGTHGRRGFGRLMLGSDAEEIARGAQVPVLLVRHVDPTKAPGLGSAAQTAATGDGHGSSANA